MTLAARVVRRLAVFAFLAVFGAALAANDSVGPAGIVEARFTDGSTLKLTLNDAFVDVTTPYGKLSIPVAEIQKIDFATRLSDDATKRVEEAVANLSHPQFPKREAASAELLKLREKGYAALLEAAKSKDAEVARRATELLDSIREAVPANQLEVSKSDVIQTEHSKISGRIEGASLKAASAQFGEVQLKLTDMRSLRIPGLADDEVKVVHADPDPGTLMNYQDKIGKSFHFKVTGANTHTIWGDGIYTTDSQLATAAVHAGVLQAGQTGIVKVTIVASPQTFNSSTKNGVTSQPWGVFPAAYKVVK
jgi:hypothetical protein